MSKKSLLEDISRDLAVVKADVEDITPRVQMLNEWHVEVNDWRKSIDNRLKLAAFISGAGGIIYLANTVVTFGESIHKWFAP